MSMQQLITARANLLDATALRDVNPDSAWSKNLYEQRRDELTNQLKRSKFELALGIQ